MADRSSSSDAQMLIDQIGIEILRVPFGDHFTSVHYIKPVAEFANEIEVLLDQHDCHSALDEFVEHDADLLDDVGLDAFGWLVEKKHLRLADEGAGEGELLLLSAGQVAAHAFGHGREDGEQFVNFLGNGFAAVSAGLQSDAEILGN